MPFQYVARAGSAEEAPHATKPHAPARASRYPHSVVAVSAQRQGDPLMGALGAADPAQRQYLKRVLLSSSIGATVEWYDFFLYGTAAALVFDQLFFPESHPVFGTLAALASFGIAYVSRPLGGLVFGHFGDKLGRKNMLVMTLLIMGVGTFCIGLLPPYSAIGIWAPVLLFALRFTQGIGLGGEWGGAVLVAVENAPDRRRGLFGSMVQIGAPAGLLLGTGVFTLVAQLPEAQFLAWGWRIPFLLSVILIGVGYFIRARLLETPAFTAAKQSQEEVRAPLLEALRRFPKAALLTMGARLSEGQNFNIFAVVIIVYGSEQLGLSTTLLLNGVLIGAFLECLTLPLFGALSDRIGRRPVFIFGAAFCGLYIFPFFALLDTGSTSAILLAPILGFAVGHSAMWAAEAAFFSEVFSTEVRYSGTSFVYQFAGIPSSGIVPVAAAALIAAADGGFWLVALFVVGYSVVSVVSVVLAPETNNISLTDVGSAATHAKQHDRTRQGQPLATDSAGVSTSLSGRD
ncbi:MAG TPA: MFS transporter [Nocardioidaceae bacterium]|nr:MFS transporter [Nocardioidaceae bacterium]